MCGGGGGEEGVGVGGVESEGLSHFAITGFSQMIQSFLFCRTIALYHGRVCVLASSKRPDLHLCLYYVYVYGIVQQTYAV